jgi:excinuclease ABC subunit B
MGRAARNIDSEVIMYADTVTKSMDFAMKEVERRRIAQLAYNKKHGITPQQIEKAIRARLVEEEEEESDTYAKPLKLLEHFEEKEVLLPDEKDALIRKLRKIMSQAAKDLDFEKAAEIRDRIKTIQQK